jgi:hypothetical protein
MKKETAEKKTTQVQTEVKLTKVKLINYTIKAVIPTGPFGNIQPEITVSANSIEDAQAIVFAHIETLFKTYLDFTVPKPAAPTVGVVGVSSLNDQIQTVAPKVQPVGATVSSNGQTEPMNVVKGPVEELSDAFKAAAKAISGARTEKAIVMFGEQIGISIRLMAKEKSQLFGIMQDRRKALGIPQPLSK